MPDGAASATFNVTTGGYPACSEVVCTGDHCPHGQRVGLCHVECKLANKCCSVCEAGYHLSPSVSAVSQQRMGECLPVQCPPSSTTATATPVDAQLATCTCQDTHFRSRWTKSLTATHQQLRQISIVGSTSSISSVYTGETCMPIAGTCFNASNCAVQSACTVPYMTNCTQCKPGHSLQATPCAIDASLTCMTCVPISCSNGIIVDTV